ncbi:tetratricopeptide repeat protein 7 [Marchantia polymorpha subsp. ruderalis]|uniref:RNA helicase n=2 Tax=Marchantia polymorpha TaxID=3197 RepID=A0AAF6BQG2_MARPO|nr:hypothetical protein MARPO_0016s0048 [Marchantia polymorpha]BBN14246.1 hypothetical protein Mp_6g10050 [Marchantia polymorpha subsp. ruderalis]|eukprot:PTQ44981.1 hypothetical protein MARPO_0016s0048 [Marchantia polymorpha]
MSVVRTHFLSSPAYQTYVFEHVEKSLALKKGSRFLVSTQTPVAMGGGAGPNSQGRGRGGGSRGGGGGRGRGGGGRGGGGGGQRWWDPEWRAERLRQMREEGPNEEQLDQNEWWERLEQLRARNDRQEEIIKTNYGREGAQLLEGMANQLDLYFHAYNKGKNTVLVVSKIPLPNYRADLDDRHGSSQRQIRMSSDTENRVENMLAGIREADAHTAASLPKEPENSSVQPTVAPYRLGARKGNQTDLVAPMSMTQIDSEKLNADLREKQRRLQTLPAVKAMSVFREKLPAFKMKEELLRAVANNQVVVVSGETGCGKTTQLPQFLLEQEVEAGRGSKCNIICTQPRRISAMSVAARVAAERGDALGQSVGYQIRLESKRSENTRLLFCTTGVLLRRLVQEPELAGVSHVMVDEIHERGMNEDFLLIILRDLLPRRPDLRLVLMSATINAELFSKYFGNAPMMHIPGFTFPVQELFLEDVLEKTRYRVGADQQPSSNYGGQRRRTQEKKRDPITQAFENADIDAEFRRYSRGTQLSLKAWNGDELDLGLVESTIEHICERESEEGALLVFLTGWDDISKLMEKLKANAALGNASRYLLLPLHGSMPTINQREIFQPPPRGVRKIVLATNIAETSITIDDVVYVIDCGKAKETSYDALNKLACLLPSWISKASAHQRRGRAGRVRAGVCYHLYPKLVYDEMLKFQLPEILRTPLQELCLQIKSLGLGSIGNFLSKALQPPEAMAVQNAIDLLKTIGALDDKEDLTPLGSHLAQLPVDPKVGKMLLMGAVFQCLGPALTIAAALAHRDPFVLPIERKEEADESRRRFAGDTQSDHVALLRAYDSWQAAKREGWEKNFCWTNYLSPPTLQMMEDMRRQFVDLISDIGFVDKRRLQEYNVYSGDMEMVKAVLCAGLFPSVVQCKQRGKRTVFFTKEDGKVEPHPASVNARVNYFPEPWLVYSDKVKTSGIYVRQSTNLSDYALLMFGGSLSPSKEGFGVDMLDGYLQFQAPAKTIQLVQDLRYELDLLLERKVKEPQFDIHKEGKGVVNAVLELLHSGQRKSYSSPSSAWGPDDGDRAQGSSSSSSRPYHGTGFNSRR